MPIKSAQRLVWWWSLALALFALSAFASIVLSTGIANADAGDPSSADSSQAKESQAKESPAKESPADHSTAAESADTKGPEPSLQPAKVRHTETVVKKADKSKSEPTKDEAPAAVDEAPPSTEPSEPVRPSKPTKTDEPTRTEAPTKTEAPVATEEPATTRRSSLHDVKPEASNVVALPTASPKTLSTSASPATPHQTAEQFVRQVVGLVSDAGIVGASLVNNLAVQAALAIGPQPFWGLPYHVANAVADSAANVSKVLSGTPLDATSVGPFKVNYGVLDVLSFFTPTKVPAGANDSSITVSAAHPLPVILVNGTVETQSLNWSVGAPVLANAGYKVYTFNYGNVTPYPNYPIQSTADIRQSAAELSDEIDRVLRETKAPKVILVGHSQGGGILPEYYLNEMGGADKVSQLIGLAPSNHGTDFSGLVALQKLPILGPLLFAAADLIGPALGQQLVTSPFQQVVYGGGDTQEGVLYTTIASTNDEVVTPYTQQALSGPAVTNIVLQDLYPGLPAGHVGVAFIPQTWAGVLDALAANPQANPLLAPVLAPVLAAA